MLEGLNGWEALDGGGVHRPATALRAWPRQQTLDRQLLLVCICCKQDTCQRRRARWLSTAPPRSRAGWGGFLSVNAIHYSANGVLLIYMGEALRRWFHVISESG